MISYATVGSANFEASLRFFDAALGALGMARMHEYLEGGWVAYGNPVEKDDQTAQLLWVSRTPFDGAPASVGNGVMIAFAARSREAVDAFHTAALRNGGSSEGAPGIREAYGPDFYVAYVRDPMGNKFAAIVRGPA
jgi:catechol 2,3-dioxygenase-like lactoylglutathione lyase family enzyme